MQARRGAGAEGKAVGGVVRVQLVLTHLCARKDFLILKNGPHLCPSLIPPLLVQLSWTIATMLFNYPPDTFWLLQDG